MSLIDEMKEHLSVDKFTEFGLCSDERGRIFSCYLEAITQLEQADKMREALEKIAVINNTAVGRIHKVTNEIAREALSTEDDQ